jgi:hypothetical protein
MTQKLSCFVLCLAVNTSLWAQLGSLPASSPSDGVIPHNIGVNAGINHWDSLPGLASFRIAGDGNVPLVDLGITFGSVMPAGLLAARSSLGAHGGDIRAIFLGESAGWLNDFGYSYDGNPASASSYTVFTRIQACPDTPYPVNVHFGEYVDVGLAAGAADSFDFWLNAVGGSGLVDSSTSTVNGGVYTVFNPAGSSPSIAPGNIVYRQQPLMVSTWEPATMSYRDVATYVVGFEDSRPDNRIDGDYSDLVIGFQFFLPTAVHFDAPNSAAIAPIPEPTFYGWVAAVGLLGLIVQRSLAAARRRRGL